MLISVFKYLPMISQIIQSLITQIGEWWYIWIFILMAMESSIIPIPSEVVMIPAWLLAQEWHFNVWILIFMWWAWSVFGALVNYYILWKWLWKPFLQKYGKYFLITEKKYQKAESLFVKNDKLYTFVWRFIPVVRHLISIPAWVFRMKLIPFITLTFIWASIWCGILVGIGYYFWENMIEVITTYTHEISIGVIIAIIIWWIYFLLQKD